LTAVLSPFVHLRSQVGDRAYYRSPRQTGRRALSYMPSAIERTKSLRPPEQLRGTALRQAGSGDLVPGLRTASQISLERLAALVGR